MSRRDCAIPWPTAPFLADAEACSNIVNKRAFQARLCAMECDSGVVGCLLFPGLRCAALRYRWRKLIHVGQDLL